MSRSRIPSEKEEQRAILALSKMKLVRGHRHASAIDDMIAEGHDPKSVKEYLQSIPIAPTNISMPMVCLLYRGIPAMSGNIITQCTDCGEDVQHRPDIPKNRQPYCVFCVTKKVRLQ